MMSISVCAGRAPFALRQPCGYGHREARLWKRCEQLCRGTGLWARVFGRIKWFLAVSLLNLFPLPQQAGFRESFAYAGESVDRGYSILVFPEGHHTTDGKMRPFQAGVGLLAKNLAIPIVPIRIDGLFELKKAGRKFARPGQIQVKIGAPVQFPRDSDPKWIARELQSKVEQL